MKVLLLRRMMEGSLKNVLNSYPLLDTMNSMVNGIIYYVW